MSKQKCKMSKRKLKSGTHPEKKKLLAQYRQYIRVGDEHIKITSWGTVENVLDHIKSGLLYHASNWELIPDEFKDKYQVLMTAIEYNGCIYEHLTEEKKQRKDLVLECVENTCKGATRMMKHIPDVFKSDIDVVLLLISEYNSDRPDSNMDILPSPYEWCDPDLLRNPLFAMNTLHKDPCGLVPYLHNHDSDTCELFCDNKTFVMLFVKNYQENYQERDCGIDGLPHALSYVSDRLCNDAEVVLQALLVDKHCECMEYVSKNLCEKSDFIIELFEWCDDWDQIDLERCPFLACNIDFIIRVIEKYGAEYIKCFDQWFRNDYDTVVRLLKIDPLIIEYISENLRDNLNIVKPHFAECPSDEVLKFASKRVRDFIISMKELYSDYNSYYNSINSKENKEKTNPNYEKTRAQIYEKTRAFHMKRISNL